MQKADTAHNATHLAEEGGVDPLVERERPLRRENANGAFVVLVCKANDDNVGDFPFVSNKSIQCNLRGAVGAVLAQYFNCLVDADDSNGVQKSLEDGDGRSATDVERVRVCNGVW